MILKPIKPTKVFELFFPESNQYKTEIIEGSESLRVVFTNNDRMIFTKNGASAFKSSGDIFYLTTEEMIERFVKQMPEQKIRNLNKDPKFLEFLFKKSKELGVEKWRSEFSNTDERPVFQNFDLKDDEQDLITPNSLGIYAIFNKLFRQIKY